MRIFPAAPQLEPVAGQKRPVRCDAVDRLREGPEHELCAREAKKRNPCQRESRGKLAQEEEQNQHRQEGRDHDQPGERPAAVEPLDGQILDAREPDLVGQLQCVRSSRHHRQRRQKQTDDPYRIGCHADLPLLAVTSWVNRPDEKIQPRASRKCPQQLQTRPWNGSQGVRSKTRAGKRNSGGDDRGVARARRIVPSLPGNANDEVTHQRSGTAAPVAAATPLTGMSRQSSGQGRDAPTTRRAAVERGSPPSRDLPVAGTGSSPMSRESPLLPAPGSPPRAAAPQWRRRQAWRAPPSMPGARR